MFPAGFDPCAQLGDYVSAGVTHVAGTTMIVPAGQNLTAFGEIDGHVVCHGSIAVNPQHAVRLDITDGVEVMPGGVLTLRGGSVSINDTVSRMAGGQMSAGTMTIAPSGTASFTHSAGTTSLGYQLIVGKNSGSSGTLFIDGGELTAQRGIVGYQGATGRVVHTAGKLTVTGAYDSELSVRSGVYELSGTGEVVADGSIEIVTAGSGAFIQTGGTVRADHLIVRQTPSAGRYELRSGSLRVGSVSVGSYEAGYKGTFVHSGGSATLTGTLNILRNGSYSLEGTGQLDADRLDVCALGRFVQTGGTAQIATSAVVSGSGMGEARIEVSAGELDILGQLSLASAGSAVLRVVGADGRISAGSYVQGTAGRLICSPTNDGITRIDLADGASLSGILEVEDLGAGPGKYELLRAGTSISGAFSQVLLPDEYWTWGIDGGQSLWVRYVPEPGTLSLLVLGGMGLVRRSGTGRSRIRRRPRTAR